MDIVTTETLEKDPRGFYEDIWPMWRDMERYAPAPNYLRRMVMKELSRLQFDSVLDVGCGEGSLLMMIHEKYPRVRLAGTELSRTALQYCREQFPDAELMEWDIEAEAAPQVRYDLVVSMQVFEHLRDDLSALKKLREVCDRYVLISVPGGRLDDHGRRNGHYRHYTREGLSEKLEQAGFEVVRAFTCGWPVHSLLYRQLMRRLPKKWVQNAGLGAYTPRQKALARIMGWAWYFNLSFVGTEVFAIARPRPQAGSTAS